MTKDDNQEGKRRDSHQLQNTPLIRLTALGPIAIGLKNREVAMTDEKKDSQTATGETKQRSIWLRLAYMIAFAITWNVAVVVLVVAAIFQFVVTLFTEKPIQNLISFGRDLAVYLGQIVRFQTFATEDLAFPFASWPQAPGMAETPSKQPAGDGAEKDESEKKPARTKAARKTAPKRKTARADAKTGDQSTPDVTEETRQ